MFKLLRSYIFWTYERGSLHYDVMVTLILLFLVDKVIGLRVSNEDEHEGLDLSQHGEEGYDLNS